MSCPQLILCRDVVRRFLLEHLCQEGDIFAEEVSLVVLLIIGVECQSEEWLTLNSFLVLMIVIFLLRCFNVVGLIFLLFSRKVDKLLRWRDDWNQ